MTAGKSTNPLSKSEPLKSDTSKADKKEKQPPLEKASSLLKKSDLTASIDLANAKEEFDPTLGLLEEDDEFEEFPMEDWHEMTMMDTDASGNKQDPSKQLWMDNWDDDDVPEDFAFQLRSEMGNIRMQA